MTADHLYIKDKLLNPQKGDVFTTDFYLDGWRLCDINFGSKWVSVSPVHGKKIIKKFTTTQAKEIFKKMYWNAASTDALYKSFKEGNKKRAKGWELNYE